MIGDTQPSDRRGRRLRSVPQSQVGRGGVLRLQRHDPADRVGDAAPLPAEQQLPGQGGAVELAVGQGHRPTLPVGSGDAGVVVLGRGRLALDEDPKVWASAMDTVSLSHRIRARAGAP